MLLSIVLVLLGGLAFWRAETIGRALRSMDSGRLMGRDDGSFGADARAYTFFVRFTSLPIAALGLCGLLGRWLL
jgi:hypothetical protein